RTDRERLITVARHVQPVILLTPTSSSDNHPDEAAPLALDPRGAEAPRRVWRERWAAHRTSGEGRCAASRRAAITSAPSRSPSSVAAKLAVVSSPLRTAFITDCAAS